jgi:FlaA1/EpsC-like NDP-sugar epimerase
MIEPKKYSMQPISKYSTGVRYGLIAGFVYAILLFLRYTFFANSLISLGIFAIISYIIILILFLLTGMARKKELLGYADFKDIFQSIFIAILITELIYVIFNAVYLKYVDTSFFDNLKLSTRNILEKSGLNQDQIDDRMKGFDDVNKQLMPIGLIKGFGTWVIIDSIIGMIYASILRKKKDIFQEPKL